MGLETGNFISDLIATNPTGTDPRNQGDDHIRLVKSVLKTTFPNVSGAITLSHTEINSIKQIATETEAGIVEKATTAEAMAGTANKFPDAAGVHVAFNQYGLGRKYTKGAAFDVDVFNIPDGDYFVSSASVGTKPPGQASGHLNVSVGGNGLTTVQLWRQATGTRLWARSGGTFSGVWTDWSEIYHSGSAKIKAIALAESTNTITGTTPQLNITGGNLKTWNLTANSTPTDGILEGESLKLRITDGAGYTITWPSVVWIDGTAPTLSETGRTHIELWKEGGVLYGALVGETV